MAHLAEDGKVSIEQIPKAEYELSRVPRHSRSRRAFTFDDLRRFNISLRVQVENRHIVYATSGVGADDRQLLAIFADAFTQFGRTIRISAHQVVGERAGNARSLSQFSAINVFIHSYGLVPLCVKPVVAICLRTTCSDAIRNHYLHHDLCCSGIAGGVLYVVLARACHPLSGRVQASLVSLVCIWWWS